MKSKLSKGHTVSKPWEVSSVWKAPGDDVRLQEEPPKCSKERTENAHAGYYKAYLWQFTFGVSRKETKNNLDQDTGNPRGQLISEWFFWCP